MSQFPVMTPDTASEPARETLEKTQKVYGFIPNLYGMLAQAPSAVDSYLHVAGQFGKSSLSPSEQQVVLIATSEFNECTYCVAAHSVVAQMSKVSADVIEALRNNQPLADAKLEALRRLTAAIVESRGWPSEEVVQAFYDAGYGPRQYLEVVLGISLKTLSNYANHIASTPLDDAFAGAKWEKGA